MSQKIPPPLPSSMARGDMADWAFVRIWREGDLLVMRDDADLPRRCVKTNEPADVMLKRQLSWHHPAIYAAILAGVLVYLILALVLRKQATIHVGLSAERARKRRNGMLIGWALALGGTALIVFAIVKETGPPALIGVVLILAGLIWGIVAANVVRPQKIEDGIVYLKGVCPAYLDALPER